MSVQEIAKGFAVTSGIKSNGVPVCAQETLEIGETVLNTETVTIDAKVYTFQTTLTDVDGNVLIGATFAESLANLIAAINLDVGAGTTYAASMTLHPTVEALPSGADMIARAKDPGVGGNSIAIAETMTGVLNIWTGAAVFLSGGLDGQSWSDATADAVALGANDGLELKTESIVFDVQLIDSDGATGVRSRVSGDRGNQFHNGDATFDLKYRGLDVLFGLAFGNVAAPVETPPASDAYLHVFKPAVSLTGLMGSLAFDKQISVWEYPSVKVGSISISGSAGAITEMTVTLVASGLNRNKNVGTNTFTTMATVTVPAERQFVLFEDLDVHLVTQADASFDEADKIYPSAFELTMNNNMATDQVTTKLKNKIDEATEDGFFEVTGSMTFPVYEIETIVDLAQSKAVRAMRWNFNGGDIIGGASTEFPRMSFFFPEIKFGATSPNVGGPGRIGYDAEFSAARAAASPASFPAGYTDAVVLEVINGRNTNPILSV
jgi:hypothetical protein